jgi:MFS family permease
MGDIAKQFHIDAGYLAWLSSAVQLGFITGTLVFAILSVSDRFSPSKVFFACAFIAAGINLGVSTGGTGLAGLMGFRFATGVFLAGIYPVGMKIASDHYEQGLGRSLGFLVGALVLGTALPHLLRTMMLAFPWRYVIFATSLLSALGGLAMMVLVPDGPGRRPGQKLKLSGFLSGFKNSSFRSAAFGYFGHMWELYAFWVFVPVILAAYNSRYPAAQLNVPLLSFLIIAAGSVSCVASGLVSQTWGTKQTATAALLLSGVCCVVSPLLLFNSSATAFIIFLFVWSMAVIADSPLFSTLVAQNAPAETKGTSLTIVNCIGFAITIISIQLINVLRDTVNTQYIYMLLALGPALGLTALFKHKKHTVF